MSTYITFLVDNEEDNDTINDDPATVQLQIYTDGITGEPYHRYTTTAQADAQPLDELMLEVDDGDGAPTLKFSWRSGQTEVINVSNTPSPTKEISDGSTYTSFVLPVPRDLHAEYEFTFTNGVPGYPLTVKVKKKG